MKNTANKSLATTIILIASLVSVLLLIVTPLQFMNFFKDGVHAIWGWTGIFGGDIFITAARDTIHCDFNWVLYVNLLLTIVLGVTTYLIGPKAKGYYIFAAIIFVVIAIINFTTVDVWLKASTLKVTGCELYLGIGPWVGGIGGVVSAISCIVAHSFEK